MACISYFTPMQPCTMRWQLKEVNMDTLSLRVSGTSFQIECRSVTYSTPRLYMYIKGNFRGSKHSEKISQRKRRRRSGTPLRLIFRTNTLWSQQFQKHRQDCHSVGCGRATLSPPKSRVFWRRRPKLGLIEEKAGNRDSEKEGNYIAITLFHVRRVYRRVARLCWYYHPGVSTSCQTRLAKP